MIYLYIVLWFLSGFLLMGGAQISMSYIMDIKGMNIESWRDSKNNALLAGLCCSWLGPINIMWIGIAIVQIIAIEIEYRGK